jgi:hypothetical protein
MLAATNSSHPVSTPTPTPALAPVPAMHLPPLPPSVPQFPQPAVHPPYHGGPAPQQISQSLYPSQVSMHSSPAPPPQQQQQQPMSYYGVPQMPPQQQPSPVAPAGPIDGIDADQKVSCSVSTYRRDVSLTRNAEGDAASSPSFNARTNQSTPTCREGCYSCSCEFTFTLRRQMTVLTSPYQRSQLGNLA